MAEPLFRCPLCGSTDRPGYLCDHRIRSGTTNGVNWEIPPVHEEWFECSNPECGVRFENLNDWIIKG